MILVTGATGSVGGHLVRLLCTQGARVRALVRSPEKADALRGFDCEVVVASFEDADALDRAAPGATQVFVAVPTGPRMAAQELAVLEAVRRKAPEAHVVKLAMAGYDRPDPSVRFVREHRDAVQRLVESGLSHTVLACSPLMQHVLSGAAAVQERSVLPSLAGQASVSHVDARDIAGVAAHLLTDGRAGASCTVTGPEALTYDAMADCLSARLGRLVRHEQVPAEQARAELLHDKLDPWIVEGLLELAEAFRAGDYETVTDEVGKATGEPARSFDDFLSDHLQPFR